MFTQILDVERVVPIDHILSHIISFRVVMSEPPVAIHLDIEIMGAIIRTYNLFETIPLFECQSVKADKIFKNALAAVIFGHKLN